MGRRASRAFVTIGLQGRGVAQRIASKRLLHAYRLGLPKCGAHSLAEVFAPPFRSAVPPDRLLVRPAGQLTESLGRIAEFVGAPMRQIASDRSHAYRSPRRHGIVDEIDTEFVNQIIEARCGTVQRRLFGADATDT